MNHGFTLKTYCNHKPNELENGNSVYHRIQNNYIIQQISDGKKNNIQCINVIINQHLYFYLNNTIEIRK